MAQINERSPQTGGLGREDVCVDPQEKPSTCPRSSARRETTVRDTPRGAGIDTPAPFSWERAMSETMSDEQLALDVTDGMNWEYNNPGDHDFLVDNIAAGIGRAREADKAEVDRLRSQLAACRSRSEESAGLHRAFRRDAEADWKQSEKLLYATEAVCGYARHNYSCDVGNAVVCDCGYTEAQNKREALRGGGDDAS